MNKDCVSFQRKNKIKSLISLLAHIKGQDFGAHFEKLPTTDCNYDYNYVQFDWVSVNCQLKIMYG